MFGSASPTGTLSLTAFALSIGSLDDTNSTAITLTNNTTAATDSTIALGGPGNSGNGVSGNTAPDGNADLLYVGSNAALTVQNGINAKLNLVLGQRGNFNVVGTARIYSAISDGGNAYGLTKSGTGTLFLSGANTYSGTTQINQGVLELNFAPANAATTIIPSNSPLVFGAAIPDATTLSGGTLLLYASNSGPSLQSFSGTTLNAGMATVTKSGQATIALGAITRRKGATILFTNSNSCTTTTANTAGTLLGGWAVSGPNWATSAGSIGNPGAITAFHCLHVRRCHTRGG